MKISELIENLRQFKLEHGNVDVYIYDPHDAEYDHIELETEHFNVDEHEGDTVLVLSAEED